MLFQTLVSAETWIENTISVLLSHLEAENKVHTDGYCLPSTCHRVRAQYDVLSLMQFLLGERGEGQERECV